ncbi:phytanoyl-CoA dioxygenase family protein [uncultured Tateyamaria sp.]|uniref:phytanoyl-CoA dioxygenase family protein n=1 Tax=uncultured Tateyamaria sp. TaxID=455651 RepID=UPI00261C9A59|nr:phytanoyl-CoA dioxygenase family protein [uncultured Tateyamaria sp.]
MVRVTDEDAARYQADGVVLIKGLFADHIDSLRAGIARNMAEPGPYASTNDRPGDTGLFFDDYCNWQRIPEFHPTVHDPRVAEVAATLMGSQSVQMFHDHVLVKEPGTSMATPWHQDAPYYFVEGQHTISFWSPLDPVHAASLRCVAGSHLWEKDVVPTRWVSEEAFFEGDYMPVPDPEAEGMRIVEYEMEPGDTVAFHFRTLHGARGNQSDARRRAFSLRLVGDDARFVTRPGPTSPPFPGHGMVQGQRLREDWFPILR